jgi:hypothetical protein
MILMIFVNYLPWHTYILPLSNDFSITPSVDHHSMKHCWSELLARNLVSNIDAPFFFLLFSLFDFALPQAQGGKLVPVQMGGGSSIVAKLMPQISCKEVLTMAASAHLTGKQTDSVLADIRAKLGRSVIEPGVKSPRAHHNSQYREFSTAAVVKFWSSEGELVNKPFFWCSSLEAFLNNVAEKRGRMLEECRLKFGGDIGKGFFKLTASLYVPASRTAPISKKMRRSREDGVSPVGKFAETGQRMILLLAWCKGIPESAENLQCCQPSLPAVHYDW